MKATELMIWDWVYNSYHKKNIRWNYGDMFCPNGNPVIGKDLHPIPLTPEILKKNGFTYNKNLKRYEIRNPHIEVVVYQNEDNGEMYGFYVTYTDGSALKCREYEMTDTRTPFVHELQHVLRLCGLNKLADNFKI